MIGVFFFACAASAQLQTIGNIKDNNNWGIRVHHVKGTPSDYRGNGTAVNITATSFVEIMGPFELDRDNSPMILTESGNASVGHYTVRKTSDKFWAIAYSGSNYSGNVTYLKLNQTYSNLYGSGSDQGIKSLKTMAKSNYRDVNNGGSSGSWTTFKCRGDHPNVSPAAKDIQVQLRKCFTGLPN